MAGSEPALPRFDRRFFSSPASLTRIGDGELGGKAHGLVRAREILAERLDAARFPAIEVGIPRMVVLTTDRFDAFVERNRLEPFARSGAPDDRIAHAFQRADLPVEMVGDLRALVTETRQPLAVRSSSLLEDALYRPFAGVYETKMIPNNQAGPDERFRRLVEAIKLVWASTYFRGAREYARAIGRDDAEEKMAVIVQQIVGLRRGERYYPQVSGVAKSFNFYPAGRARPEDGVVSLALGLGKTVVDGGVCWSYSPAHPKAPPPFASVRDVLDQTQVRFWAVHMGRPPAYDPIAETEYLVQPTLAEAEYDGMLEFVASTYDARSERLRPGTGPAGPRVIDFAPLLQLRALPLNDLVRALVEVCREALGAAVEIEFALTIESEPSPRARLGFLQVRPMAVAEEEVQIDDAELDDPAVLVATRRALGNGVDETVRDVVYVPPERFEAAATRAIAEEIDGLNARLVAEGRPYLLIGFGRWGSADPWLGIPVAWGQISGARAIVEATLPEMNVEPSQGSHFFHNLSSFRVSYFMVHHATQPSIDWGWLGARRAVAETAHARHVRLDDPLLIKVDGRTGRGLVRQPAAHSRGPRRPGDGP